MAARIERARATRKGEPTLADLGRELRLHALVLAVLVGVLWIEEVVDLFLGGALDRFGIRPREVAGLIGIPLAPFLHAGFPHLVANTLPLIVLGWFVMLRETWHFFAVSAVVILLGGLGVWIFGASGSVHVGASGLVFGWLGYLMLGGWFERRIPTILGSLLVAVLYGGLVLGVLPGTPGVSWESHLFGFLAGVLMAWVLARRGRSEARA